MIWNSEKENLERLINVEKKSYEEIGRIYNVCGNTIKKQAKKLGIELTPRREINPRETFNKKEKNIIIPNINENITFEKRIIVGNLKNIGEIGERIAIGELAKFGIDVLLPMSDNLPYDFVIYYNNKFYKCQVKSSNHLTKNDSITFSLVTNNWYSGNIKPYTSNEVDIFICCDMSTIYLFKFDELNNKKNVTIRYCKTKSNQIKNIKFAADYIISDKRIEEVLN